LDDLMNYPLLSISPLSPTGLVRNSSQYFLIMLKCCSHGAHRTLGYHATQRLYEGKFGKEVD